MHGYEAQWLATNHRIDRNVAAMDGNVVKWRWQCYSCRKLLRLRIVDKQNIDIGPHQDRGPVREAKINSERSEIQVLLGHGSACDQGVGLAECFESFKYGRQQVHLEANRC